VSYKLEGVRRKFGLPVAVIPGLPCPAPNPKDLVLWTRNLENIKNSFSLTRGVN